MDEGKDDGMPRRGAWDVEFVCPGHVVSIIYYHYNMPKRLLALIQLLPAGSAVRDVMYGSCLVLILCLSTRHIES